ncbi:MAG: hypothetical protein ACK56I_11780, partial [bacterium]
MLVRTLILGFRHSRLLGNDRQNPVLSADRAPEPIPNRDKPPDHLRRRSRPLLISTRFPDAGLPFGGPEGRR